MPESFDNQKRVFKGVVFCTSPRILVEDLMSAVGKSDHFKLGSTIVFLWILWNFWKHLFYRTPLDDFFCSILTTTLCRTMYKVVIALPVEPNLKMIRFADTRSDTRSSTKIRGEVQKTTPLKTLFWLSKCFEIWLE